MPTRHVVNKGSESGQERPFAVFHVNKQIPEEIHTETVMAEGPEQARAIAQSMHRENSILHVRTIGEPDDRQGGKLAAAPSPSLPGARFIRGEFRAVPFNDETLPDPVSD